MEEAKDIRELKSLLSGLSPNEDARHFPVGMEGKAADAYAQKIALFKSLSVLFFSLSLFLFLSLLFVLARGYLATPAYNHTEQTIARPVTLQEVPSVTEPAPVVSGSPVLASPAVLQPDPKAAAAAETKAIARTVVLNEAGGSLYCIALQHYGKADETIFDLILQANPAIADVRRIDNQQKIILPDITAESYVKGSAQDGYRIHVGTYETAQWAGIYGARVKSAEKSVFVEPQQFSSHDTWYRLLIGDFNRKEEALQTVSALVKRGLIFLPPPPR